MTTNITDVDTFTDPVVVPTDGDTRDAASVEAPFQMLSNRTRRLMSIAEGTQDVQTPQSFTRVIAATWLDAPAMPGALVRWEAGDSVWVAASTANAVLRGSLNDLLSDGCTVTRVRAMVTPAAVRAGADRMLLEVERVTYGFPVAPALTPATDSSASIVQVFDDTSGASGTAQQVIDSGIISEVIDKSDDDLALTVWSGNGGSAGDIVHAVELTFTDPGRRW